jgi:hypothetical protein
LHLSSGLAKRYIANTLAVNDERVVFSAPMIRRALLVMCALLLRAPGVPGAGFQVPVPVPSSTSARAVVSRADLIYTAPVARSEEGIPIGNGRMGTLVWTTPSALKFQINRVDIQPINKDTRSFFERNTDYMGGAGFVDLELAGSGSDLFTAEGTNQHLSVYEGRLDVKAAGVNARILAWHERDVIAIEVDDRRTAPEPIQINLRMLRSSSQYAGGAMEQMIADRVVAVRTRDHTAASRIAARDGRILLTQDFDEGAHHAKSAVAIALLGRRRSRGSPTKPKSASSPRPSGAASSFSSRVQRRSTRALTSPQPRSPVWMPRPRRASMTSQETTPNGGTRSGSRGRLRSTAPMASRTMSPRTITTTCT